MSRLLNGAVKGRSLSSEDTGLARESGAALADFVTADAERLTMRVQDERTGQQMEAAVPAAAMRLLADALAEMAEGRSVTLVPLNAEVSTQRAAGLLGVSRPHLIKLLERGEIPYRKVGEQRRVRYRDLLSYMEAYKREATAALDEMAADAQRLGL
jgi:excisionase family DNA binding protein